GIALAVLHQEALDVRRVGEAPAAALQQGHGRKSGEQAFGVALGDVDGRGNGGNRVVPAGDGGEDVELDGRHQRSTFPVGLRDLLQARGVQSRLLRHRDFSSVARSGRVSLSLRVLPEESPMDMPLAHDMPLSGIDVYALSPDEGEAVLRRQLAAAYRLVDHFGWTELIYGHLTARVPGDKPHFLINPFGLNYDEVTASNLVKIDLDGNKLELIIRKPD